MDAAVKEFVDLCEKYGTDKHHDHNYSFMYAEILTPFRMPGREVRLLEIGIESGGSLRLWLDYLALPYVFGIDVKKECCANAPPKAIAFCGSQTDVDFLGSVVAKTGGQFDIIIDDGGHGAGQAEATFGVLWPHLRDGGIYVIEDLEITHKQLRLAQKRNTRTTRDWLMDEVRSRMYRHRRRETSHDSVWTFWSEACVVRKLPEGT